MKGILPIQETGFRAAADEWIHGSLSAGDAISEAVEARLNTSAGTIHLLGGDYPIAEKAEDFERGQRPSVSDAVVARFMATLSGVNLLLVEDDLRLRTDPHLWGNAIFFGDAVVRWLDLLESATDVPEFLRRGASGYPLNAFLLRATSGSLGLSPGRRLDADAAEAIAERVCGIIVAAYDAEAYLVWLADDVVVGGK